MYNHFMFCFSVRRWSGIFLLVISLLMWMWAVIPPREMTRRVPLTAGIDGQPAIHLMVKWPETVRVRDKGDIRLFVEMQGVERLNPTALEEVPPDEDDQQNMGSDLTGMIMAEARLDINGFEIKPAAEIQEALAPNRNVSFSWNIQPRARGEFRGMIWLHLNIIPESGGERERLTVSAQRIEIRSVDLLGLNGAEVRWVGGIGLLIGAILGLDGFWSRLRKKIRSSFRWEG